jgi:hypothetical protein
MTVERILEIEKMLAGYEAWRERWFNHSGCRATIRPGEIALRELLEEVKSRPAQPSIDKSISPETH